MAKSLPDTSHIASRPSWKKMIGFGCIALTLIGVGVLAGFFAGRDSKPVAPSADAVANAVWANYGQMPAYGTPQAAAMMNAAGTPDYVKEIYILSDDSKIITEDLTRRFVEAFRQQLAANPELAGRVRNFTATHDLSKFRKVAKDVLNYLRHTRSVAILDLLRRFSAGGGTMLTLTDVDPDALRAEINTLLNLTTLNSYYAKRSNKGCSRTKQSVSPPNVEDILAKALETDGSAEAAAAGRRLLHDHRDHLAAHRHGSHRPHRHLHQAPGPVTPANSTTAAVMTTTNTTGNVTANATGSSTVGAGDARSRRRSNPVGPSMDAITYGLGHRHLLQGGATTTPVNITADEVAVAAEAESESHLMPKSVQDMLCSVQSYSPDGLHGVANFSCPADNSMPRAPFGSLLIPLVFHCFQYVDESGILQPPYWEPHQAAQNLVDVSNDFYNNTGIQFQMQEVRTDPNEFPYLLLSSRDQWQLCTRNDAATDQGMACLRDISSNPNVSSLTATYVINILVSGSSMHVYCKEEDPVCNSQALGFANPYGAWFGPGYDPNWREGLVTEEWLWMQFNEFSPLLHNSERWWNAGACTLAHELGHYLGLRHTHQGDCSGNGVDAADAVPDTPANMEFWMFAESQPDAHLNQQLAEWCTAFREGDMPRPQVHDLLRYESCPSVNEGIEGGVVDNVFNLLSYLPDACCMVMSQGQVARLHEMVVQYRPGMVAARSVGAI